MKKIKSKKKVNTLIIPIIIILLLMGSGYALLNENLTIEGSATIKGQSGSSDLPEGNDFEVTFYDQGSTGGTFTVHMSLKNTTSKNCTGWTIYIKVPSDTTLSSSWGCNASVENGILTIKDAGWNGSIAAGGTQSYTAGVTLKSSETITLPLTYTSVAS